MKTTAKTTVLALTAFVQSCGSTIDPPSYEPPIAPTSEANSDDATGEEQAALVVDPPRDYFHGRLAETYKQMDGTGLALSEPAAPAVFLNFAGGLVKKSFDSTGSFLLCSSSAQIPGSGLSAADIDDVASLVSDALAKEVEQVVVSRERPRSGSYETVLIGGAYSDLGCKGSQRPAAVGPSDLFSINPSDFAFAFLDHDPTNAQLAESIVEQALASLGSGLPSAPNSTPSGPATTQAVPGLPNLDAKSRHLPGINQIAAFGQLLPELKTAPDISGLKSDLDDIVPAGTQLPGLDRIVGIVAVANGAAANQNGGGGSGNLGSILNPNNLGGGLGALAAAAGFGSITQVIGAFGSIFGGAGANGNSSPETPSLPPVSTMPDFAAILQISPNATPGELLANLASSGAVVKANYSGADRDALLSMVKVAYAQALSPHLPTR